MSGGLLRRAAELQRQIEKSQTASIRKGKDGASAVKYNPSMEIEEFEENSELELSPAIYSGQDISFSSETIILDLKKLDTGIEYPSLMLKTFRRCFLFSGGAFLLWDDEEQAYVPRAGEGLDKTTLRRLRFSPEQCREFFPSSPKAYRAAKLKPFKPFFSVRLFDQLESLVAGEISNEKKTLAAFFLFNPEKSIGRDFLKVLTEALRFVGQQLADSQMLKLQTVPPHDKVLKKSELYREMDKEIEAILRQDKKLSLLLLDLKNVMDFLGKKDSNLDIYRARKDILAILDSMLQGIGRIYQAGENKYVFLLSSKTSVKDKLLINQIHLSLKSFFQNKNDFPQLAVSVKKIPDDGLEAASLLAGFA